MKRVLLIVGGVVALAVVAVLGAASTQPDVLHVERSAEFEAKPVDILPYVTDFKKFVQWSPWSQMDPNSKMEFSDPASGLGAWYTWDGDPDTVGKGKMTVKSIEGETKVTHQLEFIAPWEAQPVDAFTFIAEGEKTKVVWSFDEEQALMGKLAGLFMDMDAMLGADFEKGLKSLKGLAESDAASRKAAEAKAAEEAARLAELAAHLAAEASTAADTALKAAGDAAKAAQAAADLKK
jgi:hypothetical protein